MSAANITSVVIISTLAIGTFVYSLLFMCDSKLVICDNDRQWLHVKLYRLHYGLFCLGFSLSAAAIAYLYFLEVEIDPFDIVILMFYCFFGFELLSRYKRLKKNPDFAHTSDANHLDDDKITTRDSLMLCGYLLLPMLLLVLALAFN